MNRILALIVGATVATGLFSLPAAAQGFKANLMIGAELRYFPEDPEWSGQDDRHLYPSIFAEADLSWRWDESRSEINVVGFGRFDVHDSRRTHFDAREANYRYRGDEWEVLIGAHRVFWGVAESRHLINVINQVDVAEDVDGDEFLGQPMLNLAFKGSWGRLDLYAMTFFRDRTFNANDSRLRGPLPVKNVHDADFEADWGRWNVDFAARYQNSFGPVDLGLSAFHGTNREPTLRQRFSMSSGPYLTPFYETMSQGGIDIAWAVGDLVLKGEALYRFNQGSPFFATVFGGEYTIKNPFGGDVDVGLIAEFNWDDRKQSKNPPTIFDKDAFGGLRLTFNDTSDSRVLLGALVDVEDGSAYLYLEASRRVFDNWRVEVEGRYFAAGSDKDALRALDSDSFAQVRLMRYF
ncbi:MAG: hypothetical protein K0S54_2906 [Alphaproteobacteria bacterium]|jgi:hypothetical protein|nr:hypothetical protein [Alphaproteobacteria bacterium]